MRTFICLSIENLHFSKGVGSVRFGAVRPMRWYFFIQLRSINESLSIVRRRVALQPWLVTHAHTIHRVLHSQQLGCVRIETNDFRQLLQRTKRRHFLFVHFSISFHSRARFYSPIKNAFRLPRRVWIVFNAVSWSWIMSSNWATIGRNEIRLERYGPGANTSQKHRRVFRHRMMRTISARNNATKYVAK